MGNRALRSFLLSYRKKHWREGPRKSFYGYDISYSPNLLEFAGLLDMYAFWYNNDKDLKACFPMTQLKCHSGFMGLAYQSYSRVIDPVI